MCSLSNQNWVTVGAAVYFADFDSFGFFWMLEVPVLQPDGDGIKLSKQSGDGDLLNEAFDIHS